MIRETRTRAVTVTVMVPVTTALSKEEFKLYRMNGAKLTSPPATSQPAVLVRPGDKLDTWYRSLIRPETIVVVMVEPKSAEDLTAPPPVELPQPEPALDPISISGGIR